MFPGTPFKNPVHPHCLEHHLPTRLNLAVNVGDDGINGEDFTGIDKRPVDPHADIECRWMNDKARGARNRLPVDILDRGFGSDHIGSRRRRRIKINSQPMLSGKVGFGGKRFNLFGLEAT